MRKMKFSSKILILERGVIYKEYYILKAFPNSFWVRRKKLRKKNSWFGAKSLKSGKCYSFTWGTSISDAKKYEKQWFSWKILILECGIIYWERLVSRVFAKSFWALRKKLRKKNSWFGKNPWTLFSGFSLKFWLHNQIFAVLLWSLTGSISELRGS